MVLLAFYVVSNFFYMTLLPYRTQEVAKTVAELRGRSGYLAVVNMMPLIVLAGRNNPLISLLKISFDNYNLFHRWIGRIVIFESLVHVCAWASNYSAQHGIGALSSSFTDNVFLTSGLVGMLAMIVIVFQSLSAVRHAFYETFLHLHILLAALIFGGVYIHLDVEKLPALPYIQFVVMGWIAERVLRMILSFIHI